MFVELGRPENEIKEHKGTHKGHAKERAGIPKDTQGTTSTLQSPPHSIFGQASKAVSAHSFARALHGELSYRIGLVIVAVPGLLADSSPPVARCVALGQLRFTTAVFAGVFVLPFKGAFDSKGRWQGLKLAPLSTECRKRSPLSLG